MHQAEGERHEGVTPLCRLPGFGFGGRFLISCVLERPFGSEYVLRNRGRRRVPVGTLSERREKNKFLTLTRFYVSHTQSKNNRRHSEISPRPVRSPVPSPVPSNEIREI